MGKKKKKVRKPKVKSLAERQAERMQHQIVVIKNGEKKIINISEPEEPLVREKFKVIKKKPDTTYTKFVAVNNNKPQSKNSKEFYKELSVKYAKELKEGTPAEKVLKKAMDEEGIIYAFQKPFYSTDRCYIADFFFVNVYGQRFIIEVDGSSHFGKEKHDLERTLFFKHNYNCTVFRFWNKRVMKHTHEVLDRILKLNPKTIDDLLDKEIKENYLHIDEPTFIKSREIIEVVTGERLTKKIKINRRKNKKIKITHEGQPCRKCDTPVTKKYPNKQNKEVSPKKRFRYEYYYYCPKCRTMYMPKEAIVNV